MFIYSSIEKAYFNTDRIINQYVRLIPDKGVYVISGDIINGNMSEPIRIDFAAVPKGENPDDFLRHGVEEINRRIRG